MLKMLAPNASSPPSWKIKAWMLTTLVMTSTAAQGPSRMVAMAAPIRCPEVPPATVKLSICPAKMAAASTPINGTWRSPISWLTRFNE